MDVLSDRRAGVNADGSELQCGWDQPLITFLRIVPDELHRYLLFSGSLVPLANRFLDGWYVYQGFRCCRFLFFSWRRVVFAALHPGFLW